MNVVEPKNLARHIGMNMDGDDRWAKARGEPRRAGHKAGSDAVAGLSASAAH